MTGRDNNRIRNGLSLEEQKRAAKYLCEEVGFSKDVGMEILEVDSGYCKGRVLLEKRHMNPINTVHGGVFFALADTICGIAAASTGHGGPTVQGDMDYLRAKPNLSITDSKNPDISDLKVLKSKKWSLYLTCTKCGITGAFYMYFKAPPGCTAKNKMGSFAAAELSLPSGGRG